MGILPHSRLQWRFRDKGLYNVATSLCDVYRDAKRVIYKEECNDGNVYVKHHRLVATYRSFYNRTSVVFVALITSPALDM